MSDINIPNDFSIIKNNYISEIRDLIDDMTGINFLSKVADTNNIEIPSSKDIVSFVPENQLFNVLLEIENTFGIESREGNVVCVSVTTTSGGGTPRNSGFKSSHCTTVTDKTVSDSTNAHGDGTCQGWSVGNCPAGFGFRNTVNDSVKSPVTTNTTFGETGYPYDSGFNSSVAQNNTYFGADFAQQTTNAAVQVAGFCLSFIKGV